MRDEVAEWYETHDSWGVASSCPNSCVEQVGFGLSDFVWLFASFVVLGWKLVLVRVGVNVE